MKKILRQKGFTLVELLISMSIFVVFIGVLMGSYSSIVRSQREANDYRIMYADARRIFETLIQEFREGMIDYGSLNYRCGSVSFREGIDDIFLISKDARNKSRIYFEPADPSDEQSYGIIRLAKGQLSSGQDPEFDIPVGLNIEGTALNSSEVSVTDFKVYVYPFIDPYDPQYVYYDAYQFHPKVTIYASFEKELETGVTYEVEFQTSVSSRVYNQIYQTNICS